MRSLEHTARSTPENNRRSSIEIVYADHSPDNLPKVVEAVLLAGGDIIAIEKIRENSFGMGTDKEKNELSARMTEFIACDSNITESASSYFKTNEPFFTTLLDSLRGTGKRITLLDIGTDDPGYALYRETQKAAAEVAAFNEKRLADSEDSRNQLEDLMLSYAIFAAQQDEYRERVMANQLSALAEANMGKKITAMIGARHTWISHEISKSQAVDVARVFVPTDEDATTYFLGQKMRYEAPYRDIRVLRVRLAELGLSVVDSNGELKDQYKTVTPT